MAPGHRLCRYQPGLCPYGDSCMFDHNRETLGRHHIPDRDPRSTITGQSSAKTANWTVREGITETPSGSSFVVPLCKHYAKGTCTYGDLCRNRHEITEVYRNPETTLCKFFISGTCKFGVNCRLIHDRTGTSLNPSPTLESHTRVPTVSSPTIPFFNTSV